MKPEDGSEVAYYEALWEQLTEEQQEEWEETGKVEDL